jgi:phosphate uptake regulator
MTATILATARSLVRIGDHVASTASLITAFQTVETTRLLKNHPF